MITEIIWRIIKAICFIIGLTLAIYVGFCTLSGDFGEIPQRILAAILGIVGIISFFEGIKEISSKTKSQEE